MQRIFAMLLLLSGPYFLFAQTGPGGVGTSTNNGLWLRAGDIQQTDGTAVTTWLDASGNGNDAGQSDASFQPLYVVNGSLNGQPIVRLDGADDRLLVPDVDILDGTQAITYFTVLRPNNLDTEPRGVLGKRTNSNTTDFTYAYTWFFHNSNYLNLDVDTQNDRFSTDPTSYQNGVNYLLSWEFNGDNSFSQRSRIYTQNAITATHEESSTSLPNSNQPLTIGALNDNYRVFLGADYAEVIHYNFALSPLQRNLVTNYLSAKYAIPLSEGDLYVQDEPGNGNYDFDVAGIGRRVAGDEQAFAVGSGRIGFSGASDLDDDEYFLWGHDGGDFAFSNTTDTPPGTSNRLERVWRISEVNVAGGAVDIGSLDLSFDPNGTTVADAGDLRLLVDTDGDGTFADETPIGGATMNLGGGFNFTEISALANGRRFTFADASGSLPIILGQFTAEVVESNRVILRWRTQSEQDNDYFSLRRSGDGTNWEEAGRVAGYGNTTASQAYEFIEQCPLIGRVFYQLVQVDTDGTRHIGPIRSVHVGEALASEAAYPNPTDDLVTLATIDSEAKIVVFDAAGREVTGKVAIVGSNTNTATLSLRRLPDGVYHVSVGETSHTVRRY